MKRKIWFRLSVWRDKAPFFLLPMLDYFRYEWFYPNDNWDDL